MVILHYFCRELAHTLTTTKPGTCYLWCLNSSKNANGCVSGSSKSNALLEDPTQVQQNFGESKQHSLLPPPSLQAPSNYALPKSLRDGKKPVTGTNQTWDRKTTSRSLDSPPTHTLIKSWKSFLLQQRKKTSL